VDSTLADVIAHLDSIDRKSVIYVASAQDWTGETPAVLLNDPDGKYLSQKDNLTYFLEVWIALEVIDVWRKWHKNPFPSLRQQLAAVIHYAVHDSYLE